MSTFDDVFGSLSASPAAVQTFLKQVDRYLAAHPSPSGEPLRTYLAAGGMLDAFRCRTDVSELMAREMSAAGMPYLMMQDSHGCLYFLMRQSDRATQADCVRKALSAASRTCILTTTGDMEQRLLQSSEKDKEVLYLSSLSQGEAEYLRQKADFLLPGSIAGLSRAMDGTYLFCCHARTAMQGFGFGQYGPEGAEAFCLAASEAYLLSSGDGADEWNMRAQQTAEFRRARSMGFPSEDGSFLHPVWIVGDGRRYVRVAPEGFSAGYAVAERETIRLYRELSVRQEDAKFLPRLNDALAQIPRPLCLYTEEEVIAFFMHKKTARTHQPNAAKQILARQADPMLMRALRHDGTTLDSARWGDKFSHYQHMMGRLLKAVRDGSILNGFKTDDIRLLQNTARAGRLSPATLDAASSRLIHAESVSRVAERPRVHNFQKELVRYAPELDQKREQAFGREEDAR